ncbi:MmgE/PrpD family protein [Saccharopolyspora sp. NPDC000995]
MDSGLTAQLAGRIGAIIRGDVTDAAIEAARSRLFHALGVSLRSSTLPPASVAWQAVQPSAGPCTVIARQEGVTADDAAFVNGVIGHSSLQEDCGPGGLRDGSHPGTYVIPAALAAAERAGASGQRFLLALIAGYEAVGRIGLVAPPEIVSRRFRPLAVMGPFGAAAAAAAVEGSTDDQIGAALDVAATMAGGTTQGIFDGTMEPYAQAGIAARNGLLAARLGRAGTHTSRASLEGEFGFFQTFGGLVPPAGDLGEHSDDYAITRLGTKPFAACLQNQLTIGLIVAGVPGGLPAEGIEGVTVCRPRKGTHGLDSPGVSREPPFGNMLSAQMSARFTAAAAVLGQAVDDPAYYQAAFADEDVVAVAKRVDLVPAEDDSVTVEIRVTGRPPIVLAHKTGIGELLFPSATEIRERFLRRAEPLLGSETARVARLIDKLESLADLRELTLALRAPSA